jgi:hypothetical protein
MGRRHTTGPDDSAGWCTLKSSPGIGAPGETSFKILFEHINRLLFRPRSLTLKDQKSTAEHAEIGENSRRYKNSLLCGLGVLSGGNQNISTLTSITLRWQSGSAHVSRP